MRPIPHSTPSACLAALCVWALISGCQSRSEQSPTTAPPRRVFYLNSYHEGYGSSDEVMAGIRETLVPAGVELQVFFLDTKRHPELLQGKIADALDAISDFQPEVLLASDDNAVKHLVVPHFAQGPIPVVFCGVNWSCTQYGLPTTNVTGMIEVVPIEEALQLMRQHDPSLTQLTILSEDSTSERDNRDLIDPIYRSLGLKPRYALVPDFARWKEAFVEANRESDIVYLPTNDAIQGWNHEEAIAWVRQQITKPIITGDDSLMPYAVVGVTKVAREQGEWAARSALGILQGASPSDIPLATNSLTRLYFNADLAAKIGFSPSTELRERLEFIPTSN